MDVAPLRNNRITESATKESREAEKKAKKEYIHRYNTLLAKLVPGGSVICLLATIAFFLHRALLAVCACHV